MTDNSYALIPSLAGYSWRAIGSDISAYADSLAVLTAAADRADHNEILTVPVQQPLDLATSDLTNVPVIGLLTPEGEVAGVAWITLEESSDEIVASLRGRVHPDHRRQGVGSALLEWSEAAARDLLSGQPKPIRLFIRSETLSDDARAIYASHGFTLLFIEHVMSRKLSEPLPEYPIPESITTRAWTDELIPEFYGMYTATFAERPGFPGWNQAEWLDWVSGDEDFRPDFSWLAYENDQPIAFLISDVDQADKPVRAGWITEVGSHPAIRRRGIGASLLVKAMDAYRAEGIDCIALMVNDDNPKAQALYRKVGLDVLRYRGKYEKRISL